MRSYDPVDDRDREPTYRESTFVAGPGQTVRASETVREERVEVTADEGSDETEQIRVEIEETRAEMSGTVDAIQEKLNPATLADQAKEAVREVAEHAAEQAREHAKEAVREATEHAKDAVREATVGRAEHMVSSAGQTAKGVRETVLETIKANPVPAALAGLSLGWLFMNRSSGSSSYQYRGSGAAYPYGTRSTTYPYETRGTAYPYETRQPYYADQDRGAGEGITSKVGETAGQVRETAGQVVNEVGEMAGNVASSAGRAVSGAGDTAGDLGSSILDTITQNPVPAALTGVGLAWLLMNRSSSGQQPYRAHSAEHYWRGDAPGQPSYQTGQSGSGVGGAVGQAQEKAGQVAGQVQDKAGQVAGQVQDTAGQVVGQVQETAGQLVGGAQHQATRLPGRVQRMAQENPLMAGALAVTVGAAVGLAMPETQREDQLLGGTRDNFMRQAKGTAQETVQKVQQVAGEAQQAAQQAAKDAAGEQQLTT